MKVVPRSQVWILVIALLLVVAAAILLWQFGRVPGGPSPAEPAAAPTNARPHLSAGQVGKALAAGATGKTQAARKSRLAAQEADLKALVAGWRRNFAFTPVSDSTPPDANHEIKLETCILDTSATSRHGWNVHQPNGGGLPAVFVSRQEPSIRGTVPYIVQFTGPIQDEWKTGIEKAGGVLRGYVPNNAFLVEMKPATVATVVDIPAVQWVGEYRPEYKIQPFLLHLLSQLTNSELPEVSAVASNPALALVQVSVQTFTVEDAAAVAAHIARAGGTVNDVAGKRTGLVRARASAEVITKLSMLAAVQWIEEYVPPALHNDSAVQGRHMNVTNVWNLQGLTGYKQVIGHADTGLDIGNTNGIHPDFHGRIRVAFGLGRLGDWSDPDGHGTHTAGSILGDGSASAGQFRGVAFEAQLVHQSVMDAGGNLGGIPADLNDLFWQAYTNGARIHSDSWGSSDYGSYTVDSQAADQFMWDHQDMLLVFSAGNDGIDGNRDGVVDADSIGSPATAKNLLTVGAAENDRPPGSGGYSSYTWGTAWPSDYPVNPLRDDYLSQSADGTNQGLAAFSSRGPTDDARFKPDLVAPGTDVISCRSHAPGAGTGWGPHPNTNYAFSGGTSMATPLTAGAAALVRQFYVLKRGLANPSAALIKGTMINGGRSLTPGQYGTGAAREIAVPPRPNNAEGWGEVNLEDTLFPALPRRLVACDTNALSTARTNVYTLYIGSTNRVCLTLAYSDYPGTAGAGTKLVNDLDLTVVGPSGTTTFPNGRSSADRANNVEGVDFGLATGGLYTIRVAGFNVPQGPQPYALVVSGGWTPIGHTPPGNTTNTTTPYAMDAILTSLNSMDTNTFKLCWNTNGSTSAFVTNPLVALTGSFFRGSIAAQSTNVTVYYYLQATLDGQVYRYPADAPTGLVSFLVTTPVVLAVTGAPALYGVPSPPEYGISSYPLGVSVAATAPAVSPWTNDQRFVCTGWVGTGSVPAGGGSNTLTFSITNDSQLSWQWAAQYTLAQTSSVRGILQTATWWFATSSTGQTVAAPASATVGGTNYHFAFWAVDGLRRPDATNVADNPAFGIAMSTSHTAVALYLPSSQDQDGNGLPDWWENFYFGSNGVAAAGDEDADGYTDRQEYLDGTNPRDPGSIPTAPGIVHTPLANPQRTAAPWSVTATVTDNAGSALYGPITNVVLRWNRNSGGWQETVMPATSNNQYRAPIPAPGTAGDHFDYAIVARDNAGLAATNGINAFDVAYPALVLSPTNIDVWLPADAATNRNLVIANSGNVDLAWSLGLTVFETLTNNVESGTNGWTHSGSGDLWHISTNRYYTPGHAWYVGDEATRQYADDMECELVSPALLLAGGARLSYRHWYSTESGYDFAYVEISTNGGASYVTLSSFNGAGGSWLNGASDLSAYGGQLVKIRFRFVSDFSNTGEGWYVDDIAVGPLNPTGVVTWVGIAPTNGTISGFSASNVTVALNSAGMTNGNVGLGRLTVRSSDLQALTNNIPLTLHVGIAPSIAHTPLVNTTNRTVPYIVEAFLTPTNLVNTNSVRVFWNTNGLTDAFATGIMARISNGLYRGTIPAQPVGTRVYYYLYAAGTNTLSATYPTNAPIGLLSFAITPPLALTVTGTPVLAGQVVPGYGSNPFASSAVVNASAPLTSPLANGMRYRNTGWLGTGNTPASGGSNSVTFTITGDSGLDWQWMPQWELAQTSTVSRLVSTSTWWDATVLTGRTVAAVASAVVAGTNYHFVEWRLDGVRQPNATNTADNPVVGIDMSTSRVATASYLPTAQDDDGDGVPDWWERYYFGTTNVDVGGDADGDGYLNIQEYLDGTDPRNAGSFPQLPVIVHVPLTDPQAGPAPWPVTATVTDNHHVASVTLSWERNGGGWQSATMSMSDATNQFANAIPAPGTNGDQYVYQVVAQDDVGWAATNGPYAFRVAYPRIGLVPPSMINHWLMPGGTLNETMAVTNSGNTNLTWSFVRRRAGIRDLVELGANGWTHSGTQDLWRISTNRSVSATHAWYAGRADTPAYQNGMNCWLVSSPLRLVADSRLSFEYWIAAEIDTGDPAFAYDGGIVEISVDGGQSYAQIEPAGGYPCHAYGAYGSPFDGGTPCFSGTGGWQSAEFDLSAYAGQQVRLRFRFGSDESVVAGEGWYIDNIVVAPESGTNDAWWSASATNGVLAGGAGTNLTMIFDAAELAAGVSRGMVLEFTDNDPTAPTNDYQASIYVGPPVRIAHEPLQNTTNKGSHFTIPYIVDAQVTLLGPLDTNALTLNVLWNTTGSTNSFLTNAMLRIGDLSYSGSIPAQPPWTHVYYLIRAELDAAWATDPPDAPVALHHFQITSQQVVVVAGNPAAYGTSIPPYGTNVCSYGNSVSVAATDEIEGGIWRACTGWIGAGGAPAAGSSNHCSFTVFADSTLTWQWETRYSLTQTSMPAGVVNTGTWWAAGTTADTVTAAAQVAIDTNTWRFADWFLDGMRQPDATGRAVNPVTTIAMSTSHVAWARYFIATQDADGDGLPDWWEYNQFGSTNGAAGDDGDGDGYTDSQEYAEGTDPRDPASHPYPPVITHTPLADPQTNGAPWTVTATVTDNFALGQASVAGQALRFDGTNDYVMINPIRNFPTDAITVEFWMKTSSAVPRNRGPFSYAASSDPIQFDIYHTPGGMLIFRNSVYVESGVSAADGAWHHVAVTWRAADGETRVYKDGAAAWSGTLAAGVPMTGGGAMALGNLQLSVGGGFLPDYAFDGTLDEVRLWNVVRSAGDIATNMNRRLAGTEPGLAGYWRIDEGTGVSAADSTTNLNSGIINEAIWTGSTAPLQTEDVTLWWNRNSNGWQSAFCERETNDLFQSAIPAPGSNGDRFEYRLQARDGAGLTVTNGPHAFRVAHPAIRLDPSPALTVWMRPDTVANRSLSVSNWGTGTLVWTLENGSVGFADDMESGVGGWTHSGAADEWHLSTGRARSGTTAWYAGADATRTYADYMNASLVTPPVTLHTGAVLRFQYWADLEMNAGNLSYDGGIVEISIDGGVTYQQIAPVGGYPYLTSGGWDSPFAAGTPCFAGQGGAWQEAVFDLAAFPNREVLIRFRMGTDFVNSYAAEGWFIDDVTVLPQSGSDIWLTITPTNGTLAAGVATNVTLELNSASFTGGTSRARGLVVRCNDADAPVSRIGVELDVADPPTIIHTPLPNTTNTAADYLVDALITPATSLRTDTIGIFWNLTGSTTVFASNGMTLVAGDEYAGSIPAQPLGSRVYYFIAATAGEGIVGRSPTNAPATMHSFDVTASKSLVVTGTPWQVGVVSPAYGQSTYASGAVVNAWALPSDPSNGIRYACTGWTGSASVPTAGTTNTVGFNLVADSTLNWQWSVQYGLAQTSTLAGIVNTMTWWFAGTTGQTVAAPATVMAGGIPYRFAQWTVDGVRLPDATSVAVNPATAVAMTTSRWASASYLPADEDLDGDDLPDWWEYFYFGSLDPWRDNDDDGDGFTNLQEYRDGANPRDSTSRPQPPVISHVPLDNPQVLMPPWPIVATVTDNYMVAGVTLWWNRNSSGWQNAVLTGTATNRYDGAITGPGTNGDHFVYRIEAVDGGGWSATNGPYSFDVAYPAIVLNPTNMEDTPMFLATNRILQVGNLGAGALIWTARLDRIGFADDTESGAGDWTHGGALDLWHVSTNGSHSTGHAWYSGDDLTSEYGNGENDWLESGPILVGRDAHLSFWHSIATELMDSQYAYDGGIVEISTNAGASYFQVAPTNGYPHKIVGGFGSPFAADTPCFAGSGGWQQSVIDLSAYTGWTIRIKFTFGSDLNKVSSGWFLDDIVVAPRTDPATWLTVSPMSGMVAPAGTSDVIVAFRALGLPIGDRRFATLRVMANDPANPTSSVPVSMVRAAEPDTDGDGVPDSWEIAHGFMATNAADALGDADADGYLNWQEYVADTDPRNAQSYPQIMGISNDVNCEVSFSGSAVRAYGVYYATSLPASVWIPLRTNVWGSNAVLSITDTNRTSRRFYRMGVIVP